MARAVDRRFRRKGTPRDKRMELEGRRSLVSLACGCSKKLIWEPLCFNFFFGAPLAWRGQPQCCGALWLAQ